jgi:hypothetical protein
MTALMVNARSVFSGLFGWWVQELRETRAAVLERYSLLRSPRFQLQLFTDHAVLACIGDAAGEQQRFKLHENELPSLDQVWPAERPSNARIDLVLPEADALVFQLHMPPMADHELKEAVELQLERKLPLAREHLYVDWEVTQKHPDRSRTVLVAAARRVVAGSRACVVVAPRGYSMQGCRRRSAFQPTASLHPARQFRVWQARGVAGMDRSGLGRLLWPRDRRAMDLREKVLGRKDRGSKHATGGYAAVALESRARAQAADGHA